MRFFLFITALAALFSAPLAYAEQTTPTKRLTYDDRTGDKTMRKQIIVEKVSDGYFLTLKEGPVERKLKVDENLDTQHEKYISMVNNDRMMAKREGKKLLCEGTMGGEKVSETVKMKKGVPWYGSIYLLKNFVLSDEEKTTFYIGSPEECRFVKLKAVREGTETVDVGGEQVLAVKVRYTLPDIRGLFWKSFYWYRASDGILVKTEEVRGPPGTPKSFTVLVAEEETVFESTEISGTPGDDPSTN